MRDYSKVSATFWTGKTGRAIRGDVQTQIVALYLLTSPHSNMIGVYQCPIPYIAHETGSPLEGASESLRKLIDMGFCEYDEGNEIVWVLEMARYQIGEQLSPNDNQVKSIQKQFDSLYDGDIKRAFFERYSKDFCLKVSGSPSEDPSKPEAGTGAGTGTGEDKRVPACPHEQIIALYHEVLPTCPAVAVWNDTRSKYLKTRWREDTKRQSLDWWRKFFTYIGESDFLMGRTTPGKDRQPFIVDLEWIIRPTNFAKIIEGKYSK